MTRRAGKYIGGKRVNKEGVSKTTIENIAVNNNSWGIGGGGMRKRRRVEGNGRLGERGEERRKNNRRD